MSQRNSGLAHLLDLGRDRAFHLPSMKKRESVTEVMTKDVLTIECGESISAARRLFDEHGIHHLPVVNGRELVGIVSWNDLMRITFGDIYDQDVGNLDAMLDQAYRLEEVMQPCPVTVDSTASVLDAAKILSAGKFHSLPVVNDRSLVGIVTSSDLIRYLSELL